MEAIVASSRWNFDRAFWVAPVVDIKVTRAVTRAMLRGAGFGREEVDMGPDGIAHSTHSQDSLDIGGFSPRLRDPCRGNCAIETTDPPFYWHFPLGTSLAPAVGQATPLSAIAPDRFVAGLKPTF